MKKKGGYMLSYQTRSEGSTFGTTYDVVLLWKCLCIKNNHHLKRAIFVNLNFKINKVGNIKLINPNLEIFQRKLHWYLFFIFKLKRTHINSTQFEPNNSFTKLYRRKQTDKLRSLILLEMGLNIVCLFTKYGNWA